MCDYKNISGEDILTLVPLEEDTKMVESDQEDSFLQNEGDIQEEEKDLLEGLYKSIGDLLTPSVLVWAMDKPKVSTLEVIPNPFL